MRSAIDNDSAKASATALLFPGQGSHVPGMRELVEQYRPELIPLARELLGDLPFARAEDATVHAQPAIFCAGLAMHARWQLADDATPAFMAGHSLGEITALVAAGSIRPDDGLRLVAARARLMQEVCERRPGGMLALLGALEVPVDGVAERFGLTVANDNCPGQVVLSGGLAGIEALEREAGSLGLHARRVPVAGAFHSPLMAEAVPAFRAALADVEIAEPAVPVICGMTAEPFRDIRDELAEAITRPVRWRATVERLCLDGVDRFIEVGPGKVLSGLVRRTLRSLTIPSQEVHLV